MLRVIGSVMYPTSSRAPKLGCPRRRHGRELADSKARSANFVIVLMNQSSLGGCPFAVDPAWMALTGRP